MLHQVLDELQDLVAPAPSRDRPLHGAAVEHGPDAVSAPSQEPGQSGDEIYEHGPFDALRIHCPEVDRGTEVQQEPGRDLTILGVLANVRRVHPRGHVPVDGSHVVAGLVLPQVHQVQPVAAEQAAVVALEDAVEAANDLPVQALEDLLGR